MAFAYSPKIVTDGLVFAVDAANRKSYTSGSDTWYDLSGNGNHGTLTNGPGFDGANGGSLVFDGTDDYVSIPSNDFQFTNQESTYEIWVNITDNPNLYRSFIINSSPSTSPRIVMAKYRSGLYNGSVYFQLVIGDTRTEVLDTLNGNDYLSEGIQQFVGVLYYDNGLYKTKLYRDGNLISTSPNGLPSYTMPSDSFTSIGGAVSTYSSMIGPIFTAKIYNRALTPSEITQNYNALKSRFGL